MILDRGALQVIVVPPAPPPFSVARLRPDLCARVIYDPDGIALDLSERLLSMRPVTQQKDVLQRRYKISDTHLEIIDPSGLFIESSLSSVISDASGAPTWPNTPVLIQVFDGTAQNLVFTYRGFLIGISAGRGKSTLRLGNRFPQLFRRKPTANDAGQIVASNGEQGVVPFPPATGSYLSDLTTNLASGPVVETWTFNFTNATQFEAIGSRTGSDGTGDRTVNFTSDSGRVTALAADWVEDGGSPFASGTSVKIKTVYRYIATDSIDAFIETLTSSLLGGLALADVDATVEALRGTDGDQPLDNGLVVDTDVTVLDLIESLALHMLAVGIEKSDGKVGLSAYFPKLSFQRVDDVLCKHIDLMAGVIDHTPLYNVFTFEFDYNETNASFDDRFTFPANDANNTSLARFGRKIEAPNVIKLKGYTRGNIDWIRSMAQQDFVRWGEPRELFNATLKSERLGMELDEFFRVDSEAPTTTLTTEAVSIRRRIFPNPGVDAVVQDVSFYLQFERDCGFGFTNVGHRHDNCWLYF